MNARVFYPLLFGVMLMTACTAVREPPPTPTVVYPTITPLPTFTTMPPTLPPATATLDARRAISTPRWFDAAVLYEIFPRSFYDSNGDGIGDLNGIRQKLDYVQSLGATAIWLTPIQPSPSYHGYDPTDYFSVNPQFGTEQDFKNLVAEMHRRGMRLIVDYVANHSSDEHPFFKDAYHNPQSKYSAWYQFVGKGNVLYQTFDSEPEMPAWDHTNPEVNQYFIDVARYWLDLGADGLRCDYALGVSMPFWDELRAAVKAKYPDAVLLGEVWSGSALTLRDYFNSGFDALFNFPLYFTLSGSNDQNGDGVLNGVNSPRLFDGAYLAMQRLYPRGAQLVQFPSNHDTNRIASDAEGDIRRMKLAAVLTFVSPGTPMIYYGEEIGMRGNKSDGNPYWDEYRREPMDWYARETGPGMTNWFKPPDRNNRPNDGVSVEEQENDPDSLLNFYRQMVKMRAAHPALARGDFRLIEFKDCETCFGLWRWAEGETIASVLNFGPRVQTTRLDVANAPVQIRGDAQFLLGGAGEVSALRLEPWGSVVVAWK